MFEPSAAIRRPAPACLRASDAAGRLARVVTQAESKHLERVLMAAESQWLQETECAALLEKYGSALQQAGLVSSQPPWRPTGGLYAITWSTQSTLSDGLELDSSKEEVIEVGSQRLGCCHCTCKASSAEGTVQIQRRHYWLLSEDASHSGLALVEERAETGFTSVKQSSWPLFTIQSYSPKEGPASGGVVVRLSVQRAREVGAAAIGRLRANFGGVEASAVLVDSTVYCTLPAAQRPGRVPLFLTLGDGQPVSSQVDFCWLDAVPVLPSQAAPPAMPAACRSAAAGGQQPAAAGGEEEADESQVLGQGECPVALEAARVAMREERYSDAYDHFSTVVELGESSRLQLQGVLGRLAAALKLGRVQQAAAEAQLARRLAPGDARCAVAESLACMAGQDMGQALRSLKRAREADPLYPGIDRLAQAALEAGRRRVRARRQGLQEEQEQSDCASEPQQPSSSDEICLPEESSDSAEAEEARVVVLGMRDKGHLLPEHVALRYPWPQACGAPRPVLHRLITPPQSATRKRPLPYSRCSSTISDGLTSEGQTSSEVGSPGALAAMDAAGIGSFQPAPYATVPSGYTPERAGVQGALAGLELGSSSAGRAASGLLEGLPSVVLEEPSGFECGDAEELGSQEPATTTQAAKAGCFFF
ncbi:hypothetical protein N2152v2_005912 [Parachlorella kessleri]